MDVGWPWQWEEEVRRVYAKALRVQGAEGRPVWLGVGMGGSAGGLGRGQVTGRFVGYGLILRTFLVITLLR